MLTPNDLVPTSYGISSGADEVAPADLGGIDAQPGGRPIHQALAHEVALGPARGAQRAGRRLVRHHRPEIARVVRHAVRAGEQRGAELRGHQRGRPHVGADVGMDHRAHPEDAAVGVEPDLDLVRDLARVIGGHEVLAPVSRSTSRAARSSWRPAGPGCPRGTARRARRSRRRRPPRSAAARPPGGRRSAPGSCG